MKKARKRLLIPLNAYEMLALPRSCRKYSEPMTHDLAVCRSEFDAVAVNGQRTLTLTNQNFGVPALPPVQSLATLRELEGRRYTGRTLTATIVDLI
jgi:hypothetical protein